MQKKIKIPKGVLIFISVITGIIVVGFSLSKYESSSQMMATARVALIASNAYVEFDDDIKGYPGCEPKIYELTITNKEENKICEVTQKYSIKIENSEFENLPLEVSIYKDAECTDEIIPDTNGYYKQDDFIFYSGVEGSKKVYLKVEWPVTSKNPAYAFEVDYFRVRIIGEQLD